MKTTAILILSLHIWVCTSCSGQGSEKLYSFKNEKGISNEDGIPKTDSTYYFPLEVFVDSVVFANSTEVKLDTFSVEWFSRDLHRMQEPVLYNSYLDKEIYRLTWLRSFHPQVVIRLEKQNDKIKLIEKKLIEYISEKEVGDGMITLVTDSIKLEESSKFLSDRVWKNFEYLFIKNDFHSMPSTVAWEWGNDGSEWILEKHNLNGYYVVNRWSPDEMQYSKFREIGDFLIDNSRFKDEERY